MVSPRFQEAQGMGSFWSPRTVEIVIDFLEKREVITIKSMKILYTM